MSRHFKFAALATALLGAASLTAMAGPASADAAHPVIGFAVYDMTSWVSWGQQGAQKIADANNAKLLWRSARGDVNTQISQIQELLNQKVDVLVVAAVNSATLGPQLEAAKKAGIPVVATNMRIDPPADQNTIAYIGPNDVGAGEQEAQAVVDVLKGKGGVVVLQGPIGQSAEQDRSQGIKNVLAKNAGVKVLAMQPGNWDRTQAYKLTQDWLSRYGNDLNGIIAENDDMAIGAIQALKEKSLNGKIPVAGIDGIKDGMRTVKSGDLIATNLQDAAIELGEAVQVAVDHLNQKTYPQKALLNMPVVTKDNVQHYYDQLYVEPKQFLAGLPELVKANLASGNYANQ